jgi:hypothetical protein
MNLLRSLGRLPLMLMVLGCVITLNPGAASAQVEPDTTPMITAKAIDAILYTNSSRQDLLVKLKPYAAPMQSIDDVKKRLKFGFCFGSGPGVMQCQVADSGLTLVFDPEKKLRLMRRSARTVGGVAYPDMSITDQGFEWHGYRLWYPN